MLAKRREFRDSPKLSGSGAMLTNIRLQRGQGEEFQSHPIIVLGGGGALVPEWQE